MKTSLGNYCSGPRVSSRDNVDPISEKCVAHTVYGHQDTETNKLLASLHDYYVIKLRMVNRHPPYIHQRDYIYSRHDRTFVPQKQSRRKIIRRSGVVATIEIVVQAAGYIGSSVWLRAKRFSTIFILYLYVQVAGWGMCHTVLPSKSKVCFELFCCVFMTCRLLLWLLWLLWLFTTISPFCSWLFATLGTGFLYFPFYSVHNTKWW